LKKGLSIAEHMNNYTKLLTDLVNVDMDIEEQDKALMNSFLMKSMRASSSP